jgi:hypothetical protein
MKLKLLLKIVQCFHNELHSIYHMLLAMNVNDDRRQIWIDSFDTYYKDLELDINEEIKKSTKV